MCRLVMFSHALIGTSLIVSILVLETPQTQIGLCQSQPCARHDGICVLLIDSKTVSKISQILMQRQQNGRLSVNTFTQEKVVGINSSAHILIWYFITLDLQRDKNYSKVVDWGIWKVRYKGIYQIMRQEQVQDIINNVKTDFRQTSDRRMQR